MPEVSKPSGNTSFAELSSEITSTPADFSPSALCGSSLPEKPKTANIISYFYHSIIK
jgi:hypothetical protein